MTSHGSGLDSVHVTAERPTLVTRSVAWSSVAPICRSDSLIETRGV